MCESIIINECKHYILNKNNCQETYFIHSRYFVEEDSDLFHPLGCVFKPAGCNDTLIRFVRQPNNETFMFKVNEWNNKQNPFNIKTMGKIRVGNKQNSFLNGEWVGHARRYLKKATNRIRRIVDKKIIKTDINE